MPTNAGWSTGEPVASADINAYLLRGNRNAIINGDMRVAQRGTSISATDDVYTLDRWTMLSDAATVTVAQSTSAPTDGLYSMSLTPVTTNKKFGIIQFIEQQNCVGMFNQQVTLSFKARVSSLTNLDNVKCAILSWAGTADTVTSDVVSAWGAEGTNPTLVSNWTYENTPTNLNVTTSFATYRVTATIDTANVKNIAVFIWSDVTTVAASDVLYVTDVQCEIGAIATPFERRPITEEQKMCQRYYYRTSTGGGSGAYRSFTEMFAYNTTNLQGTLTFPTTMRRAPQAIEFGGSTRVTDYVGGSVVFTIGIDLQRSSQDLGTVSLTSGGLVAGKSYAFEANGDTAAFLAWGAEL